MINTVFLGINIILGIVVWKYILKPSILDHYRDALFDIREDVREYYISNNISLNDKTYRSLRDLINSHLRFTEDLSFEEVYLFGKINVNKELKRYIKNTLEANFYTDNQKLSQFIKTTRLKAILVLLQYMIFSSPILIAIFIFVILFHTPVIVIKRLFLTITHDIDLFGLAIKKTSNIIDVTEEGLEEVSLEYSVV